jgi:UDP-glucuronate 4-epimerase
LTERRAFVTGAAGFVGSSLVDRLLAEGWVVTGFDNFDAYYPRPVKLRNLANAFTNDRFRLVTGDTRNHQEVGEAVRQSSPEVVFDLAARAGVRPSIEDPNGYVDVNIRGLQNTLRATAQAKARLVFASSSSVYGDDPRQPFSEEQAQGRPMSPYGATKVAGEGFCHVHHALTGLPVGIARLFTVFGPRQRPDLAIHHFARQMLDGEAVELFDQGRGMRDYTFVDDAVDALIRLAAAQQPFLLANVGSEHPVATAEVVTQLENALHVTALRKLLPAQPGDVIATYADVTRAKEVLGWQPTVPFSVGIERFCAWLLDEASHASG